MRSQCHYRCSTVESDMLRIDIINSLKYPYANGFTEGCNNKIKVLKLNAFDYRSFERSRKRILHMSNQQPYNNKVTVA